jgi:lipopolysaccharide biosynthesis glycosyltransferase
MQLIESQGTAMRFLEQDILNIVLQGRKEVLPGMWNIQRLDFRPFALRELGDVESFTGVMHFVGEAKPWTRWADPWGQSLYLKYAEPLGLPPDFWREPETIKQKMLEARAADTAGDPARANAVRRELVRLLLRICGVQTGSRRIDEI